MMKKRHLYIVCAMMSCALLCCGCGDKGTAVLIGQMQEETEGQAPEGQNDSREAGQPGATGQPGQPENTGQSQGAQQSNPQQQDATIRVYVCGAVANPGVVEIPQGSRVEDALKAAGGFGPEAGREAVNLADWVSDGQKLYFPREGEALEETQAQADSTDSPSGLVNINTADAALLCTLPGIGESRARDIISYREANGGFETCEDIMKVSGIKTAAYDKIKDKITVK